MAETRADFPAKSKTVPELRQFLTNRSRTIRQFAIAHQRHLAVKNG